MIKRKGRPPLRNTASTPPRANKDHSPFTIPYSLFPIHYSPFPIHYSPFPNSPCPSPTSIWPHAARGGANCWRRSACTTRCCSCASILSAARISTKTRCPENCPKSMSGAYARSKSPAPGSASLTESWHRTRCLRPTPPCVSATRSSPSQPTTPMRRGCCACSRAGNTAY